MQWDEPHLPGKPLVRHEPGEVADIDETVVTDLDDLIESGSAMETTEMLTLVPRRLADQDVMTPAEGTATTKGLRTARRSSEGDES
jgi:hypothetical protein